MTPEQRHEFESQGLTCLRGAVDPDTVSGIRDRVWQQTEQKLGICRDDPSTWRRRVPPSIMKKLKESEGLFDPIMGPVVTDALDGLLGQGCWRRPEAPGQLIMTPPQAGDWRLPHKVWHMDAPAPGWVGDSVPGAQVFLLLDRLAPQGGGTLVVGGSHRLIQELPERETDDYEGHSAQVRKALRIRVPWLRELWQDGPGEERIERFLEQTREHQGVPLRVLEMTGEPGDVFVSHLWMLHAGSMNSSGRMRMVVTERLFGRGQKLYSHNRD